MQMRRKKKEKEKISSVCSHIICANSLFVINIGSEMRRPTELDRVSLDCHHFHRSNSEHLCNHIQKIQLDLVSVINFITNSNITYMYISNIGKLETSNSTLVASIYLHKYIQMKYTDDIHSHI